MCTVIRYTKTTKGTGDAVRIATDTSRTNPALTSTRANHQLENRLATPTTDVNSAIKPSTHHYIRNFTSAAYITTRLAKMFTQTITNATCKMSILIKNRPTHIKGTSQGKIRRSIYSLISNVRKMKYWNAIVDTNQEKAKGASTAKRLGVDPSIIGQICVWRTKFAKPASVMTSHQLVNV